MATGYRQDDGHCPRSDRTDQGFEGVVVKKVPHSEKRWRQGRIAIRVHDDLREAIEFVSKLDNRPISNFIETLLLAECRARLSNVFSPEGERLDKPRPLTPGSGYSQQDRRRR